MVRQGGPLVGVVLGVWIGGGPAWGADPQTSAPASAPPGVMVRLVRPDLQCKQVLALFQGARAPHPAAALAAWKRATGPGGRLGKGWEAAIAAFNPEMAGELRGLDQAALAVLFDPADGAPHWSVTLPHDDGAFASLATALVLTDGGPEPPLGTVAVDRLGPPPAPLAARAPDAFVVADTLSALRWALALDPAGTQPRDQGADAPALASGWIIRVDPAGLGRSGPIGQRRLAEGLRGLGCRSAVTSAGLEGETLSLAMTLRLDTPLSAATINPAWLDALPEAGVLAALAVAIDPDPRVWDQLFALADRVERADPARAGVAPLRTRINLLAATVQVRPELDLWPRLCGVSGGVLVDKAGAVSGVLVALHTDSPEAAGRIAGQVLPALAPVLGLRTAVPGRDMPTGVRLLGMLSHRALYLRQQGATVRLGWGEAARESIRAVPANTLLRKLLPAEGPPPQRFGAFWPGRLALATTVGAPLAATLAESPPIVWSGRNVAPGACEAIHWTGLRDLVHRFLDRLPLDPPPDR